MERTRLIALRLQWIQEVSDITADASAARGARTPNASEVVFRNMHSSPRQHESCGFRRDRPSRMSARARRERCLDASGSQAAQEFGGTITLEVAFPGFSLVQMDSFCQ